MYRCRHKFVNIDVKEGLVEIYNTLFSSFGPQEWWPADTKLEVIVGAILTQAVSWQNVEKAIGNLKKEDRLNFSQLKMISKNELAQIIKPAGYYNLKAERLKAFISFIDKKYRGKIELMFREKAEKLRKELLTISGIGPETADSILLYAGEYPVFVVDNYTRRIFSRMGYTKKDIDYHSLKQIIESNLTPDLKMYNEYHALLVELGKNYCTKNNPFCHKCPLINT